MKIGCCIPLKCIHLAKEYGYDFVELSAQEIMSIDIKNWDETKNLILSANIPVLGFNAFSDKRVPIIGPLANKNVWRSYLDTLLMRGADLHIKNVGIGAPNARMIPENYDYKQATEEMEYFLTEAASLANKYNQTILYEALHPKECNFGNHTLEIYQSVQKINQPNVAIVYDVYHSINANETYSDTKELFDKIEHIHINSWDKDLKRYYLFEKDIRYMNEFCVFLKSVGYKKTISIETINGDFLNEGASSLRIIKSAITYANNSST